MYFLSKDVHWDMDTLSQSRLNSGFLILYHADSPDNPCASTSLEEKQRYKSPFTNDNVLSVSTWRCHIYIWWTVFESESRCASQFVCYAVISERVFIVQYGVFLNCKDDV